MDDLHAAILAAISEKLVARGWRPCPQLHTDARPNGNWFRRGIGYVECFFSPKLSPGELCVESYWYRPGDVPTQWSIAKIDFVLADPDFESHLDGYLDELTECADSCQSPFERWCREERPSERNNSVDGVIHGEYAEIWRLA